MGQPTLIFPEPLRMPFVEHIVSLVSLEGRMYVTFALLLVSIKFPALYSIEACFLETNRDKTITVLSSDLPNVRLGFASLTLNISRCCLTDF
jgi:hypothetical protein